MGVPKFFRYISERYPCLSELLRENQVPEFDNLYLDMNGIIHNCSHPNDADVTYRISEEMIFEGIFHYVEYLFKMIRPQKVFFIAVDGVAPRAKMNQQRGRRFRSAHEAGEQLKAAIAKGETIPDEDRFDSNCITPGTAFMVRLQIALEHFIQVKIATDILWKACTVILSGHETPGEGEHKIMEYIRHAKAQPGFNPNTRHCLYGLDADLIMLGLCTHERFFSLLREEVKFGKNDKKATVMKEIRFYLLHLTLLSEYLELEFASVRNKLRFPFDIHKLIDDWVLMIYLVGNDFIPHLPNLHINENALPTLYRAYMDVLPEMDGYINESGILNLPRLQLLMRRLAVFDRDTFLEHYTDLKYLESKCGKNNLEAFDVSADEIISSSKANDDLMALIMSSKMLDSGDEDEESQISVGDIENDPVLFEKEFKSYKRNYYMTKMGYADFNEDVRAEQAECYIRALQWTLHYYYRGVVSWSWYYPHHYAPFISDVDHFDHLKLEFDMARPFLPFQQLLSVLPAASKSHLPAAYHQLMIDPNSPVYDFYPPEFSTDLNGKQQSWEAVVLIPFIDERRLLKAMKTCDEYLTDEEKQRNVHGPMIQYRYDANQQDPLEAKYGFERIDILPVKRTEIFRDDLHVAENKLVLGPSKGSLLEGYATGFPTFKHLPYHGKLKEMRVKVFNFPSKNDSMVVCLDEVPKEQPDTATLARELLDKIVYVSWPHLMEAKVDSVSDKHQLLKRINEAEKVDERMFNIWCKSIAEHNETRLALSVGPIHQLVHVRTCVGTEYVLKGDGFVLNRLWNNVAMPYPAQCIVREVTDVIKRQESYITIEKMFPLQSTIFLRATDCYGCMGEVADISDKRIQGKFLVYEEPEVREVFQMHKQSLQGYRSPNDTAAKLGISVSVLLQLTGTILVAHGGHRSLNIENEKTVNIGLRLRMMSKNEAAVGFCRRLHNRTWVFSDRTVNLLQRYDEYAPGLFEKLEGSRNNVHFESDLFGEGNEGKLDELHKWLKEQEHNEAERRSCSIELLERNAIERLVTLVDEHNDKQIPRVRTMLVPPKDLLRPGMKKAKTLDPNAHFELLDRVVVASEAEDAPVGRRGTIIGIHKVTDPNPVRREAIGQEDNYYEVLFDHSFPKGVSVYGLAGTEKRVQRMAQGALLNISYGRASNGHQRGGKQSSAADVRTTHHIVLGNMSNNQNGPQSSIQHRVNERIGKRNGTRNVPNEKASQQENRASEPSTVNSPRSVTTQQATEHQPMEKQAAILTTPNNVPSADIQQQQRKNEFERFWKKLKESTNNSAFDENDIKHIAQVMSNSALQPESITVGLSDKNEKPQSVTTTVQPDGDQMTGMLKKMLRINDGQQEGKSQQTGDGAPLVQPPLASLPKPPLQWRNKDNEPGGTKYEQRYQQSQRPAGVIPGGSTSNVRPQITPVAHPRQFNMQTIFMRPPNFPLQQHQVQQQFYGHPKMQQQPYFIQRAPDPTMILGRGAVQSNNYAPPPRRPIWQSVPPPLQSLPPHIAIDSKPISALFSGAPAAPMMPSYPNRGPIGPQNLSYNRNNPAGNGAFVPLQAMKKNAKIRAATTTNNGNVPEASCETTKTSATVPPSKRKSNPKTTSAPTATIAVSNDANERNASRKAGRVKEVAQTTNSDGSMSVEQPNSVSEIDLKTNQEQVTKDLQQQQQPALSLQLDEKHKPSSQEQPVATNEKQLTDTGNSNTVLKKSKKRIAARFGSAPVG
ncbi:5'-3' exoribonuclease 1 [Anopheles darlingi]|uniref:5'-3' exoribonuclease 1 n=1 Tax=Anopheles darlingi TaxID=43151 RepID=UPI0020FFF5E5|nr:5'-3' exoribonuclease 1 [Anopheles darlingi]